MSGWDDEPRLDERRASAPEVPRHRSRKNTRRWCRGRTGVEHVLEVRLNKYAEAPWRHGQPPCYRVDWRLNGWWCNHERYCVTCGKIIDVSLDGECPSVTTDVPRSKE